MATDPVSNIIRNALNLRRYENAIYREAIALYQEAFSDILGQIQADGLLGLTTDREQRLRALLQQVDATLQRSIAPEMYRKIRDRLLGLYPEQMQWAEDQLLLSGVIPDGLKENAIASVAVAPQQIPAIIAATTALRKPSQAYNPAEALVGGRQFYDALVGDWSTAQRKTLEAVLRMGLVQSQTNQEMVKRLRESVLGRGKAQAEAIVRTVVQDAANAAQMAVLDANAEILEKSGRLVSIATFDSRVCPICIERHLKSVGNWNRPPFHINCRCTVVFWPKNNPAFMGLQRQTQELVQKGQGDYKTPVKVKGKSYGRQSGQVDIDLPIQDWLQQSTLETKQAIFGKKRGQMVHDGRLSVREAITTDGKLAPLP
jgi:SPP1 gp7 family putative phage head morphogenesis protein